MASYFDDYYLVNYMCKLPEISSLKGKTWKSTGTNTHNRRRTHPDPHEAISEYNPRQQEDKGLVTTEECRHVCCVDLPESLHVQVVGEDPQQTERSYFGEKHPGCQPVVPEKPTALPV